MAYDERLARLVRRLLADQPAVVEKKMFGGIAFLLAGNMCCGVVGDDLMVRVGPLQYDEALAQPGARPMDFTGRPLKGFVFVDAKACDSDDALAGWLRRGLRFASSLPPK